MIYGTGIDTVKVSRIEMLFDRGYNLSRIYSASELEYINTKKNSHKYQSAAGIFCAKEAFLKALGVGLEGYPLNEIQVDRDEKGKPFFELAGDTLENTNKKKLIFHLSITHDGDYAMAMAIAEQATVE